MKRMKSVRGVFKTVTVGPKKKKMQLLFVGGKSVSLPMSALKRKR